MRAERKNVTVTRRSTGAIRCAFCHDDASATDLLTCVQCGSRRHMDCGLRCPTLGCVARDLLTPGTPVELPLASGAFALTPSHAAFVAGRAPRPRFLATRARRVAGLLAILACLLGLVLAIAGVSALGARSRSAQFEATAVSAEGKVVRTFKRHEGKQTNVYMDTAFDLADPRTHVNLSLRGSTAEHRARVAEWFRQEHPVGSTVALRVSREHTEVVGQEDSLAREAEELGVLTAVVGVAFTGVAIGATYAVKRARRLDREGTLCPGRVLSCRGYTDKGGFGIHLRYEITRANGRRTRHNVSESRGDLREGTVPRQGTPLVALVAGSDHELL